MPDKDKTPFIDDQGNLVIPPGISGISAPAHKQELATAKILTIRAGQTLFNITIKGGKVVDTQRIIEEPEDFSDMIYHAEKSMGFWDNPIDDAVWNDVETT